MLEPPAAASALALASRLAVAGLIGLAAGIERERSGHGEGAVGGARRPPVGVRTFLLLALLGGVAGVLLAHGLHSAGAVLLAGGVALAVAARVAALASPPAPTADGAPDDSDGTTEAAALAVLALAALAGIGQLALAAGTAAVVALALGEKARLHWLARRLGDRELRATFQFAVLALVVLPVLPDAPIGPFGGVNLRALWGVVLLFSALNFGGYLARRAVGPERGYAVAGALGGLVSSTAVTLDFARHSRRDASVATPLAIGTLGACTMLFPRVLLVSAALSPTVARGLLPYVVPPLLVGAAGLVVLLRVPQRASEPDDADVQEDSPLRLRASLRMALVFQLALSGVALARTRFGSSGVRVSAAAIGLTDVDALTYSMSRLAGGGGQALAPALAAEAIAIGVLTNTLVKLLVAVALGAGRFRLVVGVGLAALAGAMGAAFWALR